MVDIDRILGWVQSGRGTQTRGNQDRNCVQTMNNGAPGAIPTRDLSLRRRALYAAELREHRRMNPKG